MSAFQEKWVGPREVGWGRRCTLIDAFLRCVTLPHLKVESCVRSLKGDGGKKYLERERERQGGKNRHNKSRDRHGMLSMSSA